MNSKKYTTADIARTFAVSDRTARRWIENLVSIDNGRYLISEEIIDLLKNKNRSDTTSDNHRTPSDTEEEYPYNEFFTEEEYQEFKKRITEYPFLKEQIESSKEHLKAMENQIDYFRTAYNKQLEIHESLVQSVKNFSDNLVQRNFIEAKEKGLDN